jgi:hypothetical protein
MMMETCRESVKCELCDSLLVLMFIFLPLENGNDSFVESFVEHKETTHAPWGKMK